MTEFKRIAPPKLNISEIEELEAFVSEDDPHMLFVKARPKEGGLIACPECGSVKVYKHGKGKERYIHDVSVGLDHVDIILENERYKCQERGCGRVFDRRFNFIEENTTLTKRLVQYIESVAFERSFASIAKEYGITIPTVSAIFVNHCRQIEANHKAPVAPRVLGIDENHIKNQLRGVLTDIETGRLLDLTEDRSIETMEDAITRLQDYQDIEIVCMDMYAGYKTVAEHVLKNADIIIDKYHVVQNIQRAVNDAKKQLTQILKAQVKALPEGREKDRKDALLTKMGKNTYLFKYGKNKLNERPGQLTLMADLCRTFPELNELRTIKELAEAIYEAKDRKAARKALTEWMDSIPKKNPVYTKMESAASNAKKLRKEILNYFDHEQFTNAATEGVNSLVKQMNSVGRGYSFETLRYKALYFPEAQRRTVVSRKRPDLPSRLTEEDVVNMLEDGLITVQKAMTLLKENKLDAAVYRKIRAERSKLAVMPPGFLVPGHSGGHNVSVKPKRTRPTIHRYVSSGYQIDIQVLLQNSDILF